MAKFDAAIQAENKLTEVKELPGKISAKEQEISNIRAERDDARTELSAAKSDYRAAIKNAADAYADSYEAAVAEHGHESEAAKTTRDEMRMAQAYGASKLAEDGVSTAAEHRADVLGAKDRVDRATQRLNANDDYRGALHRIERYTAMNAINTALNNMFQGMGQNIAGLMSAEATKKSAEQEQEKDQLEQTKDLFQQAQSLIDSVVQLMQAVASAEAQSMRDAIQA
jgi:predicted  nucleic acid-binding Zn-ribbon protein